MDSHPERASRLLPHRPRPRWVPDALTPVVEQVLQRLGEGDGGGQPVAARNFVESPWSSFTSDGRRRCGSTRRSIGRELKLSSKSTISPTDTARSEATLYASPGTQCSRASQ